MRDEDLKNLPQSIEGWQVAEMLEGLGIADYRNVRLVEIEPRKISVEVYALDQDGRRYFEGNEAAVHKISIPFVGNWTKPAAPEFVACGTSDGHGRMCVLGLNHFPGVHDFGPQLTARVVDQGDARCQDESPNGVVCQEIFGHDGEHRNGETFWGTPHREP